MSSPGAKAVDTRAAVAIPVDDEAGSVRAVVGMAFLEQRHFSSGDLEQLQRSASTLPA
jgi:L-methionine (R)-S-oxide reductase